jgi:hypothetical protein
VGINFAGCAPNPMSQAISIKVVALASNTREAKNTKRNPFSLSLGACLLPFFCIALSLFLFFSSLLHLDVIKGVTLFV